MFGRRAVVAGISALSVGLVAFALARPGAAACALIDAAPITKYSPNVYSDWSAPDYPQERALQLVADARSRVESVLGAAQAKPKVVMWDGGGALSALPLNIFGGTVSVGTRTCVFIGPQGRNIDVVAHELVHAELYARVGAWATFTQIPAWFDEGLAMQVDQRPAYDLPNPMQTQFVRALSSPAAFHAGDDATLTLHYGAAKIEVKTWLDSISPALAYSQLERLRSGERFSRVVP
jgi:hypothetical protein